MEPLQQQPVKEQAKAAGFGSIWNNNSWFHEEKNFNKFAKEWCQKTIPNLEITKDDVLVQLYEIKEIEGSASVTIRKQKQIFLYDFEMEVYFKANQVSDPTKECKGRVKVHDFNQDDDELNIDITQEQQSELVSKVKKILNNEMCELFLATMKELSTAMKQKDSNEIKLKQDKMEREQAQKAVQDAQEQTGAQKAQIFDDDKKKVEEFKQQQKVLAQQNLVPMKEPSKINQKEGQGSVWNNNSYHWEEKSVAGWSTETLQRIFSLFYFKHDKATLTIKEVKDLKGESSVTIRKQKKIVTYEYSVKLLFKVALSDESNTKVIGTVDGEFELPEISNDILDDGEEWEINARISKGDDTLIKTFYQLIKKLAPDALRKEIKEKYVEELKKK